jgi:hypothetical protein
MDMPTIAHPSRTATVRADSDTAVSASASASPSLLAGFTPADFAMVAMWAALAITVLAYAVARGSIGAFVAGGFVAWQLSNVWSGVTTRRELGDDAVAFRTI